MSEKNQNIINCFHCKFFITTWEPKYPKGCSLFGIKTTQMPSVLVFNSTGEPCNGFIKKDSVNEV